MRTAGLAKGVRFRISDSDLSGEGMGFGVPAIVSGCRTYLSYSAKCKKTGHNSVTRVFMMDAVQRMALNGRPTDSWAAYAFQEAFGAVYKASARTQRRLTGVKDAASRHRVEMSFGRVAPFVPVPVEYTPAERGIRVSVDLSAVKRLSGRTRVYILNEQDGRTFSILKDSSGSRLEGAEIGGWRRVEADSACFTNLDGSLAFSVAQTPGSLLYSGRELYGEELCWAGLIYDVSRYPGDTFEYSVSYE